MTKTVQAIFKITLITLASTLIIASVLFLSGELGAVASLGRSLHGLTLPQTLRPLSSSTWTGSDEVVFNGDELTVGRYSSPLTPEEVIEEYARRLRQRGFLEAGGGAAPPETGNVGASSRGVFVRTRGQGYSMLGWHEIVVDGNAYGVVAFARGLSRGSDYFVSKEDVASAYPRPMRRSDGMASFEDAPGRDAPGVPRLPGSRRALCLDMKEWGLMLLYESHMLADDALDYFDHEMRAEGWLLDGDLTEGLNLFLDDDNLVFRRGRALCIISLEHSDSSPLEATVLYKTWSPKEISKAEVVIPTNYF